MLRTPVAVTPDRFAKAFTGDNHDVPTFPVVDLDDALTAVHDTHAHFTCGVVVIDGVQALDQPRFSVAGEYPDDWQWLFHAVAVDVDAPGKDASDEWWDGEVAKLATLGDLWTTCFWYRTRGGYRLVWRLPVALETKDYLQTLHNLYSAVQAVGVKPDIFYDWTRLYMLPHVVRDGVAQTLPRAAGPLQDLPALAQADAADGFTRICQVRLSPLSFGEWPDGERNSRMFAAVSEFWRKVNGIDGDMLLGMARLLNDQRCADNPLGEDELERIVENVIRYKAPAAAPAPAPVLTSAPAHRVKVFVHKGYLPAAVDGVMAVVKNNPGMYYKQSGALVRLSYRGENQVCIEDLPKPAMRDLLERHIAFMTTKVTKDDIVEVAIDMPRELLDVVATRTADASVSELQEVIRTPTIMPDGNVLNEPGYNESMQLFYAPTPDVYGLTVGDSHADAVAAIDKLRSLLADFPFQKPEHRSTAIAALMTPLVRSAITGPTPLFIFDSTTPGSGKSLLADVAALLATGETAPRMALTGEEEFEKRVTALLASGVRAVLIDNVAAPLGGAALDALLTSDQWSGRILGSTKMVKLRSRAVWMATGNNVQIQGDLARRALRIYLDPNMERPEERDNFAHKDLLAFVRAHRAELVAAGLTITRAYIAAGEPVQPDLTPLGSFDQWSRLVRQPLVWLGEVDPLLSQASLRADNTVTTWASVLNTVFTIWGTTPFTAKEIYAAAFQGVRTRTGVKQEVYTALEAALEEICGAKTTVRNMSWLLRRWQNRIIDGMVLRKRDERDRVKGNIYYVEAAANVAVFVSKTAGDDGAVPAAPATSFFAAPHLAGD